MQDLEERLKKIPDTAGILIVTDGVFSMSGEIAKLDEIVALAKKYGAREFLLTTRMVSACWATAAEARWITSVLRAKWTWL